MIRYEESVSHRLLYCLDDWLSKTDLLFLLSRFLLKMSSASKRFLTHGLAVLDCITILRKEYYTKVHFPGQVT